MAIAALKKIEILGHNSEHDPVLEYLQQEGQVEVVDLKDKSDEYKHFAFEQQTIRYEDVTEAVEKLSWLKSLDSSQRDHRCLIEPACWLAHWVA